ncbi:autotransporter outer membrane beta-barrel domain-containing protein [Pseudohoeflea coraliihabitans]|uniref:Autotransporter outer membrane beta-barrel domain-containing protein n=1 Tax=Pseudohoeflea coraliihabitans TaxID=2860393 RepID=A0ABS6WM73_9HYPH|nr:autotransporter outer membrane beta-barrel domain-containing protein [Pseudohoeflea sp. DP4N28-3]MBW3097037.1 autotransporter outer membrane beta-barrel domain-containing protein [Pseudohoeflea sp. DP4N28-3]
MKALFAGAVAAMTTLGASAAFAQTPFGPLASTQTNGTITVNLAVAPGGTGEQTLSITYAGDLDIAEEFIDVFVDGTNVGRLKGGPPDCSATLNETITVSDAVYTAAAADGTVTLSFNASAAVQGGGHPFACGRPNREFAAPFTSFDGGTGESFVVQGLLTTWDAKGQQETVASTRGGLILQHGPDRHDRIARLNGATPAARALSFVGMPLLKNTPFELDIGRNALAVSGSESAGGLNFWSEAAVTGIFDDASSDHLFGILHVGVDGKIGPDTLLGFGLQFDMLRMTDSATSDEFDGAGWMVGPLVTHRLSDTLYLDGRLAYGQVETDVARSGGGTDSYTSERMLAQIALVGALDLGATRVAPRAEIGWYREISEAYTSATLGAVAETEVDLGIANLGARLSQSHDFANGTATPYIDGAAIYTLNSSSHLTAGSHAAAVEGWQGHVAIGASYAGPGGASWAAEVNAGGLFTGSNTLGGELRFEIAF